MQCRRPITSQVRICMGFRQDEGEQSGSETLYYAIREAHGDWPREVRLHTWRTNARDIAEAIDYQSAVKAWIVLIGYSWGGQTAVNIASELQARGRSVALLFLLDAVHRSRNPLRYYRSYYNYGASIKVPECVKQVYSYRQTANYPRGNRIVVGPDTKHTEHFVSRLIRHEHLDELVQIQTHIKTKIQELFDRK
jgi:pimeloyl-ACP methyl ester carboxylesterase